MLNILIVLLGCNIYSILMNRINVSFEFIEDLNTNINSSTFKIKITWFLSGGIKFNYPGAKSEASVMKSYIDDFILKNKNIKLNDIEWKFIIDELSTNTAENFVRTSLYLNQTTDLYDLIYIATSKFHHPRASKMINLIDRSRQYNWILGNETMQNSHFLESIHMKNVHIDISNAFNIIK